MHVVSSIPEKKRVLSVDSVELELAQRRHWSSTYMTLVAGVVLLADVSIMVYLKRSSKKRDYQ
jgi:hypothetical protein|nr:hypothetical protein Q903MT_gene302 [Picea sitchensis]